MALHKTKLKSDSVFFTNSLSLQKTKLWIKLSNVNCQLLVCKSTKMVNPDFLCM